MKIPPALQAEMYQMLLRFRNHNNGDGAPTCPKSPDYIQYAEESGPCSCWAEDVQDLIYRIDDALQTDTTHGGLA
jgi:hypothetical protein